MAQAPPVTLIGQDGITIASAINPLPMALDTASINVTAVISGTIQLAAGTATIGTATAISPRVALTNRSGTITAGGVAQTLMAGNTSRGGFLLQSQSTGDLYFSAIGTASASTGSIWLPAGAYFEFPANGITTAAISIFGSTTGQPFTSWEW